MGDVIHLNRYRKAAQRKAETEAADRNAVRHGRTKAERRQQDATRRKEAERHDEHRLITPDDDGKGSEPES